MNFELPSDEELQHLRTMSKLVSNPRAKWRDKPGHRQRNFMLDGEGFRFELYLRQSTNDPRNFSCGLKVIKPDGTPLTLCRYNGGSHAHREIQYRCHIHVATNEAIRLGKKPESKADETERYQTLDGALYCLMRDCGVQGLPEPTPDEPDLFGTC